MKITTSWDDYCPENYRLAELLKKYNIPATFYIEIIPHREGTVRDSEIQILDMYQMGFEIGCHTMSHPRDMKYLMNQELEYEISNAKAIIEDIIENPVTKFCYPRGKKNEKVMRFVKDAGFVEARTTRIGDCANREDLMDMATTVHVYQRKEYGSTDWLDYALNALEMEDEMHIWGHAWEIERDGNWQKLEELFKKIDEK